MNSYGTLTMNFGMSVYISGSTILGYVLRKVHF